MILTEFDSNKIAVINPHGIVDPVKGMPKVAVTCYAKETFEKMLAGLDAEQIASASTANGKIPIYKAVYKGVEIALFMMDVGAPASAAMMEDVYQMGAEKIIIFGTCGVLEKSIDDCAIIIPNSAMRDEGTSYHYAPPSDEIEVNQK